MRSALSFSGTHTLMDEDPALVKGAQKVLSVQRHKNQNQRLTHMKSPFSLTHHPSRGVHEGCRVSQRGSSALHVGLGGQLPACTAGCSPFRPPAPPLGSRPRHCWLGHEAVPHQRHSLRTRSSLLSVQLDQIWNVKTYVLFL